VAVDTSALDIAGLPAVLAGPVLRCLTRTSVSVWLALSRADDVTLHVQAAGDPTQSVSATATPVRVGSSLWLVTVTAGGQFAAGTRYRYRLTSAGWPSEPDWPALAFDGVAPAFVGLPVAVDEFVVMHTSCRKAHGGGLDALATATDVIAEGLAANDPGAQPHLLILSGDQIYADETPAPLAPRIRRVATDLVGIDETPTFGALPKIGGRQQPTNSFGFTSAAATDQLWTLGEFLATYLLYWSDVLWPATVPTWAGLDPANDVDPASQLDQATWDDLASALERFRSELAKVRKLLANVPSLMILDDHEVSDDWNLNYPWAQQVYGDPRGSRIVFNGVLAYVLCQHWGNAPDRFAPGTTEAQILAAATWNAANAATAASPDTPTMRGLLGVPTGAPAAPPSALRDLSTQGAIRYDVTLGPADGYPLRIVLLDERTVREFQRVDHPAARVSMAALALMLPTPPAGVAPVTIVVTPSPAFGTHIIEHVIQPASSLLPGGSAYSDFESWSGVTANHQELLARLAAYQPVVVLSGDVHYGFTGRITYQQQGGTSRMAQLTAGAAENADAKTVLIHLLGDFATKVGIERPRDYAGFHALSPTQRAALVSPPAAGTALPYDDLADVALGRVFRAGQETPAVLAKDVATAYGLATGAGDWSYQIAPVDDQTMPPAGELANAITSAPSPWPGWDADKSAAMMAALRASDLHRI
jgi:hypothetical protein